MTIKITGSRQQIAELAHDIRMQGYRFDYYKRSPLAAKDEQCLTLSTQDGRLSYYQCADTDVIIAGKELQAQLPSHRKHFLSKLMEIPYGHKQQAS